MASIENLAPNVIKRVVRELEDLIRSPLEGIKVFLNEENVADVQALLLGPVGTPYEGGCFRVKLALGNDFPNAPPKGYFLTKIFHPNVSKTGEICVNTLKRDWNKDLGIKHILLTIKCLLIEPNPESALNEEAGKLLLEMYEEYVKRAKMMTSIHASKNEFKQASAGESTNNAAEEDENTTTTTAAAGDPAADVKKLAASVDSSNSKKTEKMKLDKKKSLKRL